MDGGLTVTGPLDYEAMDPAVQGVFSLTVMAKDRGVPPLSSTTLAIITVEVTSNILLQNNHIYQTS